MRSFKLGSLLVHDVTADIPQKKGPGEDWRLVDDEILGCAIHHEGSKEPQGSSWLGIAKYHVEILGWSHIGYQFVIDREGQVFYTLDLRTRAFHAGWVEGENLNLFPERDPGYYNRKYWAVCLVGNDPTRAQLNSLIQLLAALKQGALKAGSDSFRVYGHREFPGKKTSCPGYKIDLDYVRVKVEEVVAANINLGAPGQGDTEYFKQFSTWRDAAISTKGSADELYKALAALVEEIEKSNTSPALVHARRLVGKK